MSVVDDVRRVTATPELRGLFLLFLLVTLVRDLYAQAVPLLFASLGASASVLGLAWSATKVVEVLVSPVVGAVSDAGDRTAVAAAGLLALSVLLAGVAAAPTVGAVVLLMLAVTAVQAQVGNAGTAGVNEAVEDGVEGMGWGVRDVFLYLGGALGLAGGGAVVGWTADVRSAYLLLAAASAVGGVVLGRRTGLGAAHARRVVGNVVGAVRGDSPRPVRATLRRPTRAVRDRALALWRSFRAISNPRLLAQFCAVKGTVAFGWGIAWFLLPVFAVDVGLGRGAYLLLFAAANLAAMPLSLAGGALADRRSRKWLFVANYAVEALVLAAFAVARSPALVAVGMALWTVQTLFEPAVVSYFFERFDDEEAGRVWSVTGVVVRVVGIAAPAVGGALYAVAPLAVFLLGAVVVAVGAAVATTLPG